MRLLWLLSLVMLGACAHAPTPRIHASPKLRSVLPAARPIVLTRLNQENARQELMLQGMSLIGTPYRYGGDSRDGFDCSGMIQYLYQDALHVSLPRTARDLAAAARPIALSQLKVGDLVFFNTTGAPYSHVGLYIGHGEFIHAPSSRSVIHTTRLDNAYFQSRITDARTFF